MADDSGMFPQGTHELAPGDKMNPTRGTSGGPTAICPYEACLGWDHFEGSSSPIDRAGQLGVADILRAQSQ